MSMTKIMTASIAVITVTGLSLAAIGSASADNEKRKSKGKRGINIEKIDLDKSGTISPEEYASIGLGRIIAADANGDGVLSTEEIQTKMEEDRKRRRQEAMMKRLDINGDGSITVAELKDMQDKRFAVLDRNSDGVLSEDEFQKMRGKKRKGNKRR